MFQVLYFVLQNYNITMLYNNTNIIHNLTNECNETKKEHLKMYVFFYILHFTVERDSDNREKKIKIKRLLLHFFCGSFTK